MPIRKHDVKAATKRAPLRLDELIAREHKRVSKLTRDLEVARRRLARARLRYSVLTRLAADESKRFLTTADVTAARNVGKAGREPY